MSNRARVDIEDHATMPARRAGGRATAGPSPRCGQPDSGGVVAGENGDLQRVIRETRGIARLPANVRKRDSSFVGMTRFGAAVCGGRRLARILADAVRGVAAGGRAAGEARRAGGGIGQAAGAAGLAVVERGAAAVGGAEAGAAVGAGLTLRAGGGTGVAGAGAVQPAIAGRVATIATADQSIDTGRAIAARAAEAGAAGGRRRLLARPEFFLPARRRPARPAHAAWIVLSQSRRRHGSSDRSETDP